MNRNLAAAYLEEAARILRSEESLLQPLFPSEVLEFEAWQKEDASNYIALAIEELNK